MTVSAPASATYQQTGLSAVASGGSGTGAYSYSHGASTACTVNSTTGALTITSGTGTCSITATRAGDANYNPSSPSAPASVTISSAPITVKADTKSKEYGAADPELTYKVTAGSLVSGDSFTGSLARVAGENVGSYAITQGSLSAGSNYALTFVGANLTINARPVTVTADAKSKTYGDADPALTYTGTLHGTDSFTGSLTRVAGENVGSYAIQQGSLSAGSNYALTFVGANLTINARPVTVTADAKSKTYGDDDPALTYTGTLHGTDSFTGSLERVAGENVGSYAIQQGSLSAGSNYALTFVGANLTINARPVTVTADAKSKTYGDDDPALTYTGTLHGTDSFTGSLERVAGENVGSYAITAGLAERRQQLRADLRRGEPDDQCAAGDGDCRRQEQDVWRRRPGADLHGYAPRHGQLHGQPGARGRRERRQLRDHSGYVERRQQLHADLRRRPT